MTDLEQIAAAKEVTIETRAGDRAIGTVIWVVEHDGTLYVRSFLGDHGKWYQRAVADPNVTLVAGDIRVAFQAIPATDEQSVEGASEGFRSKYRPGRSLDAMLVPEVLHTTLRLEPAG